MTLPKTLDFTVNNNITIYVFYGGCVGTKGIRLNPNAKEDLKCEKLGPKSHFHSDDDTVKRCIVPKSHFENKQNGYYNTYHLNHMNNIFNFMTLHLLKLYLQMMMAKAMKEKAMVEKAMKEKAMVKVKHQRQIKI